MSTNRNSKKLEGTFNSTLEQLTDYLNELRDLRAKALRDYKEIKRNTDDNSERIALEHIRFNALKTYENYHKMYLEALKLHLGIVSKMTDADNKAKKGSGEENNDFKITRTDKKEMVEFKKQILDDLRKAKRESFGNDEE